MKGYRSTVRHGDEFILTPEEGESIRIVVEPGLLSGTTDLRIVAPKDTKIHKVHSGHQISKGNPGPKDGAE